MFEQDATTEFGKEIYSNLTGKYTNEKFDILFRQLKDYKDLESQWTDNEGRTLLDHVIMNGSDGDLKAIIKLIQETKTFKDINSVINDNHLEIICSKGYLECLRILVSAELAVEQYRNIKGNNETILHLLAKYGHLEMLRLTIDCLKSKNILKEFLEIKEKSNGYTALFVAVVHGKEDIIRELVKEGADVDITDSRGHPVYEECLYRGIILASQLLVFNETKPLVLSGKVIAGKNNDNSNSRQPQKIGDKLLINLTAKDMEQDMKKVLEFVDNEKCAANQLRIYINNGSNPKTNINLPLTEEKALNLFELEDERKSLMKIQFELIANEDIVAKGFHLLKLGGKELLKDFVTVSLVDCNLNLVGTISFEYIFIKRLSNDILKIIHGLESYNNSLRIQKDENNRHQTKIIGHRGSGANNSNLNFKNLQISENTILSLQTAANFGAEFVEFDVQMTKDCCPVVYHDWTISSHDIPQTDFSSTSTPIFSPAIFQLSLEQFKSFGHAIDAKKRSRSLSMSSGLNSSANTILNTLLIKCPFATLKEFFEKLPPKVGFNIEIKYPNDCEAKQFDLCPPDLNLMIDKILEVVFQHCQQQREIIFSSFHPDACLLLSVKQPIFPVFFLTEGGMEKVNDRRCNSLYDAVEFSKFAGLDGIVSLSDILVKAPSLCHRVKQSGLLLYTYGALNNVPEYVKLQRDNGVDAVIVDKVLKIVGSLKE